jgi:hypothetical protein
MEYTIDNQLKCLFLRKLERWAGPHLTHLRVFVTFFQVATILSKATPVPRSLGDRRQ